MYSRGTKTGSEAESYATNLANQPKSMNTNSQY
jgi:hypothetical protein